MTAITLNQATSDLMINLGLNIPTLIVGPVGVGKTDIVRQCATKLGWPVIDKRASQMLATDVQLPMPDITTGKIVTYVPDWLPNALRDGPNGVLLLDEFTDAPTSVQAALNQLTLERELPNYRLPDGWRIVGTGNRAIDKANAQKVSRASANRLAIIEIKVDVKSWLDHASRVGVHPALIAYVANAERMNEETGIRALHRYPTQGGSDAMAFVTPRSLVRCDRYMKMSPMPNDSQLRRLFAQNVGDDSADDILNFLAIYRLAPDVDKIIADPMNAPIPREPSVNYIIGVGLVSRLTLANIGKIATYIKRVDSLYQAQFWNLAIAKDEKAFKMTAEHVSYAIGQSTEDMDTAA